MDFVAKAGALNIIEMSMKAAITVNYRTAFERIKFYSMQVSYGCYGEGGTIFSF